jgi:hypothetical protein
MFYSIFVRENLVFNLTWYKMQHWTTFHFNILLIILGYEILSSQLITCNST